MKDESLYDEWHQATYCPEDDKLRLYVGRVPKEDYLALKNEGWQSTPKQECDFSAVWTPEREDTCLSYAGVVLDEDQDPEDRAADRAERFGEYRDKRLNEATGHADRYDAQPRAHGYQNKARAVRAADRHDRIADRALTAWDKADYWTRRTAGVIDNALYKSEPGVRMGRIKKLEAEVRRHEKQLDEYRRRFKMWEDARDEADPDCRARRVKALVDLESFGDYTHPRNPDRRTALYYLFNDREDPINPDEALDLWFARHPPPYSKESRGCNRLRWVRHARLRLGYEKQMLDAQGGRLEQMEVEPGGKLGDKLILKVNKSQVSGRATSVAVLGPKADGWQYKTRNIPGTDWAEHTFDLERIGPEAYDPPTEESLAELKRVRAAIREAKPKKKTIPLVNPTDEDARRLQKIWNDKRAADRWDKEPREVARMTQKAYSARSRGSYAACETVELAAGGNTVRRERFGGTRMEPVACKVRAVNGRVIILEDKPQKPLPKAVWKPVDYVGEVKPLLPVLRSITEQAWTDKRTPEQKEAERIGKLAGVWWRDSASQYGFTDKGKELLKETEVLHEHAQTK